MAGRRKLGEILIAAGAATADDVDSVLADQSAGEPSRVGDLLLSMGKISPTQLARALAEQTGLPFADLSFVEPEASALISLEFQQAHKIVPFRVDKENKKTRVHIAVADPTVREVVAELKAQLKRELIVYVAPVDEIESVHAALAGNVADAVLDATHSPVAEQAPPASDDPFSAFSPFDSDPAVTTPMSIASLSLPPPASSKRGVDPEVTRLQPAIVPSPPSAVKPAPTEEDLFGSLDLAEDRPAAPLDAATAEAMATGVPLIAPIVTPSPVPPPKRAEAPVTQWAGEASIGRSSLAIPPEEPMLLPPMSPPTGKGAVLGKLALKKPPRPSPGADPQSKRETQKLPKLDEPQAQNGRGAVATLVDRPPVDRATSEKPKDQTLLQYPRPKLELPTAPKPEDSTLLQFSRASLDLSPEPPPSPAPLEAELFDGVVAEATPPEPALLQAEVLPAEPVPAPGGAKTAELPAWMNGSASNEEPAPAIDWLARPQPISDQLAAALENMVSSPPETIAAGFSALIRLLVERGVLDEKQILAALNKKR